MNWGLDLARKEVEDTDWSGELRVRRVSGLGALSAESLTRERPQGAGGPSERGACRDQGGPLRVKSGFFCDFFQ